ncbi:hypothetical protein F4703DRAFT_1742099, partial [Phycomyces blakesleeanus]
IQSNRSKCKGPKTLCHREDRTIRVSELRMGVEVESGKYTGTSWKHWTCVTPKVIENMKASLSDPSEIEGWDSLREEDVEKIEKAWEDGEIPEEDRPAKEEKNEAEKDDEEE